VARATGEEAVMFFTRLVVAACGALVLAACDVPQQIHDPGLAAAKADTTRAEMPKLVGDIYELLKKLPKAPLNATHEFWYFGEDEYSMENASSRRNQKVASLLGSGAYNVKNTSPLPFADPDGEHQWAWEVFYTKKSGATDDGLPPDLATRFAELKQSICKHYFSSDPGLEGAEQVAMESHYSKGNAVSYMTAKEHQLDREGYELLGHEIEYQEDVPHWLYVIRYRKAATGACD
jgi:hypothetical protein